jgi:ABC-2 type transport system permease protein
MNSNLFLKEMRRNIVSLIIWTIVITLLISVTMAVYPTFLANQSKVMGMMSLVPKGALQFKGISNFSDLLSPLGFYASNNLVFMMVLGSVFAVVLGSNILLKEEYNKTAEYLLTKPLTRGEIFISKLAVVFLNIFLLNLVASVAGLTALEIVQKGGFSIKAFLILSVYSLLLNLLFGAGGLFISTLVKRAKPVTTFTIGLVLILYFIYTISKIAGNAAQIGYISPFKYVGVDVISPLYRLEPLNVLYFTGLTLLLGALSYRIYLKKDIYT